MGHENWREDDPFEQDFRRATRWMGAYFAIAVLGALVTMGVGIWAVLAIVNWVVTK